jgi:S-adenosylmethionine:tRNA ribosyltransferase-isomerase
MPDEDTRLSAYDYFLPPDLIAQNPVVPRDHARLLEVSIERQISHRYFYELPQLLRRGDLLVLNNSKVFPARLYGKKNTGAEVEILLLEDLGQDQWLSLVKPGRRLGVGTEIVFEGMRATVLDRDEDSHGRVLQLQVDDPRQSVWQVLEQIGHTPLPPYINHSQAKPDQYQTVYAQVPGSCAAPTAGLHFTEQLLQNLLDRGIRQTFVTLHVGLGTFRPVETEDITQHKMHQEWLSVNQETIDLIRDTKNHGGRVIGVGTTTARALETAGFAPFAGKTDLMIYPSYQWRVLDGLITNFHLPKSTLLMLVSAFLGAGGRQFLLETIYPEAIEGRYRFYSFGDAMLLWRPVTNALE